MVQIKRGNINSFKELDLKLKELASVQGKVGWFEDSKYPDGTPVALIAAQNEMGNPTKNIPPRPTIRPAIIEKQQDVEIMAAQGAKQIITGSATAKDVMEGITFLMQNAISKNIATITSPPLAPATIAARKLRGNNSQKPLVDTGLEFATLTSVVEDAS